MIGVFRERFFTFRMKLKMFITSSDHYLKYLAILFLVKASGLGDFVSQNPLFSYGVTHVSTYYGTKPTNSPMFDQFSSISANI